MASITTILGTDSVSSSRIVINNNFAALNQDLADIQAFLNTTNQTLTLTGQIQGGTLRINNGVDLFKVDAAEVNVNLPIKLNQNTYIEKGLMHNVYYNAITLPAANAYTYTTYVLDATNAFWANTQLLAAAEDGQEVTFIANGGTQPIKFNQSMILGPTAIVQILTGGSLTLRYIANISKFVIVSSNRCTITY
jgi:hypothetical protein